MLFILDGFLTSCEHSVKTVLRAGGRVQRLDELDEEGGVELRQTKSLVYASHVAPFLVGRRGFRVSALLTRLHAQIACLNKRGCES